MKYALILITLIMTGCATVKIDCNERPNHCQCNPDQYKCNMSSYRK